MARTLGIDLGNLMTTIMLNTVEGASDRQYERIRKANLKFAGTWDKNAEKERAKQLRKERRESDKAAIKDALECFKKPLTTETTDATKEETDIEKAVAEKTNSIVDLPKPYKYSVESFGNCKELYEEFNKADLKNEDETVAVFKIMNRSAKICNKVFNFVADIYADDNAASVEKKIKEFLDISIPMDEKRLINTIAAKMYPDIELYSGVPVFSDNFIDSSNVKDWLYMPFIVNFKDIEHQLELIRSQDKIAETPVAEDEPKIEAGNPEQKTTEDPKSEDDLGFTFTIEDENSKTSSPIFFESTLKDHTDEVFEQLNIGHYQYEPLNQETRKQMDELFSEFMTDDEKRLAEYYQINRGGILLKLPGKLIHIDNGLYKGFGRVSVVMAYEDNSRVFVPAKCKDIIKKIFENPAYRLTQEEIYKAMKGEFLKEEWYQVFDFSKLRVKSHNDLKRLNKRLETAIKYLTNGGKIPFDQMARYTVYAKDGNLIFVSNAETSNPYPAWSGHYPAAVETIIEQKGTGYYLVGNGQELKIIIDQEGKA